MRRVGIRIGVDVRIRCNGEQPRRKAGEHAAEAHGEIGSQCLQTGYAARRRRGYAGGSRLHGNDKRARNSGIHRKQE